jgi:hypothetical protein
MLFGPNENPWTILTSEFARDFIGSIVTASTSVQIVRVADIKNALGISKDIDPEHAIGSSGRIRTYDQSVNPDEVGTLPLSYCFIFSRTCGLAPAVGFEPTTNRLIPTCRDSTPELLLYFQQNMRFGSSGRIRTYDQSVNSRPLYH